MSASLVLLALVTLLVGFVPFLNWITVAIALPLAIIGAIMAIRAAKSPSAQPADRFSLWLALMALLSISARIVTL